MNGRLLAINTQKIRQKVIIKWHQEYDQSDQPKKLIFSNTGKYLIDLEWIIIEGTWKFSGQNNIDLIDKDNDNLFTMTFNFPQEKHAEFLFTSGELKDYQITVRRP